MKAQHIRPKVQNGPIARRGSSREASIARAAKRSKTSAKTSKSSAGVREPDSRVFWMMVSIGIVLTSGFLLGLRSQINAHQLNRAEEKLKDELDRYVSQQKYLSLQQQRARSPRESERAVKEAGLLQLKLDQRNALPVSSAKPANSTGMNKLKAGAVTARTSTGKPATSKQTNPLGKKLGGKKSAGKKLAMKTPVENRRTMKAVVQSQKPKSESGRPRRVAGTKPSH